MENIIRVLILVFCVFRCDTYITKYEVKKYECVSDGDYVVDPVCRLKAVKRDIQSVTISINIKKPIDNFRVRITQFKKTYTNHFMPGFFDFTTNYCDVANETSAAAAFGLKTMRTIFPSMYQQYRENIKYCPVMGYCLLFNVTAVRTVTTQYLIPPGEYKVQFRVFDENDRTLFLLKLYQYFHDKSRQSR